MRFWKVEVIIVKGVTFLKYEKQIEEIVKYFKINEKNEDDFKIGVEFEHFIVDADSLSTISYYDDGGVQDTLEEMKDKGWQAMGEGEYLLGLYKDGTTITLEPGSQFELSIKPYKNIKDIEDEYLSFVQDINSILKPKNQALMTVGYQPETKISDIKMIPKKRYELMFNHFKTRGKYAHNMMKGTASLQMAVDYKSEEDYTKKFRVINALSPVLYALYDNSTFYEGYEYDKHCLRADIWSNCDSDRCGIVEGALDDSFRYRSYAEYILNKPIIFTTHGDEVKYTGTTPYKDIFDPENYTIEELEHAMTMFFPDVRAKKFIEIRMSDSVPYPLNLSMLPLWKGLLYNESNLNKLYDLIKTINMDDVLLAKQDIINNGLNGQLKGKVVRDIGLMMIELSKEALSAEEVKYLDPLEKMLRENKNPSQITKERLSLGKKQALDWCVVR